MTTPTLKEYYEMLDEHDWWYSMSDDYRAYKKGTKAFREILDARDTSEAHAILYRGFVNYNNNPRDRKKPKCPE